MLQVPHCIVFNTRGLDSLRFCVGFGGLGKVKGSTCKLIWLSTLAQNWLAFQDYGRNLQKHTGYRSPTQPLKGPRMGRCKVWCLRTRDCGWDLGLLRLLGLLLGGAFKAFRSS